jgi:succinyl-diaminopimelate desuccinylase
MSGGASVEDEVTRLAAELVRIDSSDPGAYEGELEHFVRAWLAPRVDAATATDGTPLATLEELEALPGRTCLRATILAAGAAGAGVASPGPADLTLCCHMDTVQLGDGWSVDTPALGGIVRDGELWGRGSCDMKGGLACAMLAFSDALGAVRRRGCAPERSVSLLCTVDEEDVMRGCEAAIRAGWLGRRGWVLDTEPTDSLARDAHKGRTWFELDMSGVTAHASTPWKGADAVAALSEAICHVRRGFQTLAPHASLGTSTVTFGQVEGGYSPYVGFRQVSFANVF